MNVVGDGGSKVRTGQTDYESGDGRLIGWGVQLLWDVLYITENMVDQDTSAICFMCGLCV